MRERKLVTIVIPVYNTVDYLGCCIESVIKQTYNDIEIILIDDGSTDGSQVFCDEAANRDARIKVIHQQNRGLSAARNAGLDIATGDYILFLDSDDYYELNAVELLLNEIVSFQADMVIGEYQRVDTEGNVREKKLYKKDSCIITEVEFWKMVETQMTAVTACTKMYIRDIWNDIRFPEGKQHEDSIILHRIVHLCKTIVYTPDVFYNYRYRLDSIMTRKFRIQNLDNTRGLLDRMEYLKVNGTLENILFTFGTGARELQSGYELLDKKDINVKQTLRELYSLYKPYALYIGSRTSSTVIRLRMWLFVRNIKIYSIIQKIMSKKKS